MASYSVSGLTSSSFDVTVKNLTSGQEVWIFVRLDSDADNTTFSEFFTATSSTVSGTVDNLEPETAYAVNVRVDGKWIGKATITTLEEEYIDPTPEKWSWTSSNGAATTAETIAAYNAVTNNGYLTDFSYDVWNDMCAKVSEMRDYAGYSWRQDYLTYLETRMEYSDKVLTADRFNSLRLNIGSLISTGINEVSKGDIIYGSYFTTLMSKVNQYLS